MKLYKHFGEMIRVKSLERRITQERLAELADLSTRQVVAIEKGTVDPKLSTLLRVCGVLGIDIGELKYLNEEEFANV